MSKRFIVTSMVFSFLFGVFSVAGAQTGTNGNLISNGTFSAGEPGSPSGWVQSVWGGTQGVFTYPAEGRSGDGAKVEVTQSGNGDAKWAHEPVSVSGGQVYEYRDFYRADAPSEITVEYQDASGNFSYEWLGSLGASGNFKEVTKTFTPPDGTQQARVFHLIAEAGELTIDDVYLAQAPVDESCTRNPNQSGLIENGSFEDCLAGSPVGWSANMWGTIQADFSFPVSGQSGDAVQVEVTNAGTGDAKWAFERVSVESGKIYRYSNDYQADVTSELVVEYADTAGNLFYEWLGNVAPASSWKTVSRDFEVPADVAELRVYHILANVGELTMDNAKLEQVSNGGSGSANGMISIDFDDGWESQYTNALPILENAGFKATFYIMKRPVDRNWDQYMGISEVLDLHDLDHEIASHTITHPDLTALTASELEAELVESKDYLESLIGASVEGMAYPYGAFDAEVLAATEEAGYTSGRTTLHHFNDATTDPHELGSFSVRRDTPLSEIKDRIDLALATERWFVMNFHRISDGGQTYTVTPEYFQDVIDYLESVNAPVVTREEGLEAITN